MTKKEAYKFVYNDMVNSSCDLLVGKYDAVHGDPNFMYGIGTAMEWIASAVGEETENAFSDMFYRNMAESEEKAKKQI